MTGVPELPVPSALHVNDAAYTAQRLVTEACRRDYAWDYLPKAAPAQEWRGITGKARRAAIGAAWVARLRAQASRHDIVHVHSASTLKHSRLGASRFVLHCHGTDVRTAQYDPAWQDSIRAGLRDAEAVFYSTPDLAEHVLPHRPDATYLPVPVDMAEVEPWTPEPGTPKVVFASRWTPDKDSADPAARQVEVAREVVAAVGDEADVVALDWGDQAHEAEKVGVQLVPPTDHSGFLELLAGAHVVVGQTAGILATSEIEALATGAPLVEAVPLPLYEDVQPPVYGGSVAEAGEAVRALIDGSVTHDPVAEREWVQAIHGVEHAVDTVADVYRDVMATRP